MGTRWRRQDGYTVIDLMVAVTITGILASMAVMQVGNARQGMVGDGAMRVVMGQLNLAREQAVAHRRFVQVTFVGTNGLRLTRIELPAGAPATDLGTTSFEGGVQYSLMASIPDTPDAFGNSEAIKFGSAQSLRFATDGSLVDSGGTPVNGTVFLAQPNRPLSFRAVTVLGTTGRVRGYRWNGRAWVRA